MISAQIKSKSYHGAQVLSQLALEITPGETVAILGPSGIGKTTLLRLLSGIDADFEGEVKRPSKLSVVFQEPTLVPWMTARDNLTLIEPEISETHISKTLAEVGLDGKESQFPGQLSLGQQRRLSLARAFLIQPEALFLDEPFVSLDKETAASMMTLTRQLIERYHPATLLVTHSKSEADALANRSHILKGKARKLMISSNYDCRNEY